MVGGSLFTKLRAFDHARLRDVTGTPHLGRVLASAVALPPHVAEAVDSPSGSSPEVFLSCPW